MASGVFGAKLRTWMSKMRGSNNNCSPTKDTQGYDLDSPCTLTGGPASLPFFGNQGGHGQGHGSYNGKKIKARGSKRRKLNCMTVSNSQSFDRIRQQMYEDDYGCHRLLNSPNGNTNPAVSRLGASATAPWDPRVPPYHSQVAQTPSRMDVVDSKILFQAPRSVSLSSPESAYGSGNSEDSLTPASSTHPDLHHFPGRQHWLMSSGQSYSSLRQHSNPSVANCATNNGTGSTRSVDRPKIKTNPWVTFQRQMQPAQQSADLRKSPDKAPSVSRTQSLSFKDKPTSQAKRAQSFRSPLFGVNRSGLNKISSESESDWDEDEEQGHKDIDKDSEDIKVDNASSSADAVCGSSKLKTLTGSTVTASPIKSMTFAGERGFMMQLAKYRPKALMFMNMDKRAGGIGKTVNCPNCFLMSRHHLGRKHRCQPKPPLDSQLCAYCRSWILAEEDSSTDVDTDSDFNETESSTSSNSSPIGAGRNKKRQTLSSYNSYFGAAARRRRWRKTLPAPTRNLSRELSTSCSSFLFEGDFGEGKKPAPNTRQRTPVSSDSDEMLSQPSSGNGNRCARALPTTPVAQPATVNNAVNSVPLRGRNPVWRQPLEEPCVSKYDAAVSKVIAEDPMGYKTLLSSMETLMAKFGELAGSPVKKIQGSPRPRSSDTILEGFGNDLPWRTSTPHEPNLIHNESCANSLNQGFSSRSSLGLTANGSSCDTLTELPLIYNNGATYTKKSIYLDTANGNQPSVEAECAWANGNSNMREFSPMKDLSSPMSSVETGSVTGYPRKSVDFRSRYTEEPLVKCKVEEEVGDPLETIHLHNSPFQGHLEDLGSFPGDRRSFNSLEEKLKKLRQERMLLEAKIREARDEDKKRRKEKISL